MPDTLQAATQNERSAAWNRDVQALVGPPLRPELLRSVLIAIPGSSGDIVLTTTIIRWIKERNPACQVSFAVKRSNLPLLALCPGVDEAIEIPILTAKPEKTRRQVYLEHYAGRADAVVYPVTAFEDMPDLFRRYNFLEAMWLMAGVPDGMPPGPHRLWLDPPRDPQIAAGVLRHTLNVGHYVGEAARQPGMILRRVASERRFRDVGWKDGPSLLRLAALAARYSAAADSAEVAGRFVIVSSEANALPPPAEDLFPAIVRFLRSQGRVVLQNVRDPLRAVRGALPLVCSYEEFLALRNAGIPFIGWRSGLCDIAAIAPAPMAVLYPETVTGWWVGLETNCESVLKSFGFASMGVAADCVEHVCDSRSDLDIAKLVAVLGGSKAPQG